jgi:DNA-binding CsgD family transcriptional regulator
MTTSIAGIEQLPGATLERDSRPVAALARSADDLPDLEWEPDESEGTRFVVVAVDGQQFALESEDDARERQITIYGRASGLALDQLIKKLGVDDDDVVDRVDRPHESDKDAGTLVALRTAQRIADISARLAELEARARWREEHQKRVAAALVLAGEELTERQRETLALLAGGFTRDEIAGMLHVRKDTVSKHMRDAFRRFSGAESHLVYSAPKQPRQTRRKSRRRSRTPANVPGGDSPEA